jgi:hypothetical protein
VDSLGVLSSTTASQMTTQLAGLATDLATIQWEIGVASYGESWVQGPGGPHDAKVHTTWTPQFYPYFSSTMDTKLDVQRRRK